MSEVNNLLIAIKKLIEWYGDVVDFDVNGESIWFENSYGQTYTIFIHEVHEHE